MRISSLSEDLSIEKRVSLTPEIAKKYISMGFEISLPKNYSLHLGVNDQTFKDLGVKITDVDELIVSSDLLIQLNLPKDEYLSKMKDNQSLVGVLNPFKNKNSLQMLSKKKYKFIFIRVIT